uniref:ATP synthase complex subunit 8 n=1 Tax=Chrysomeloidea sp. 7 KM-2017 TaxID=2219301 RepID=A0A346RHI6_9CUCU|nr:ATP synthase F0 subunit 8 [Chrysomeloidea sp. 7 KM-2017]
MPQMAPMNWLALFTYFVLIFFLFNVMNYFSFFYSTKTFKKSSKTTKYNWKW